MATTEIAAQLLTHHLPPERVRAALLPRAAWRPYPTATERAGWQVLPDETRAHLVAAAELSRGMVWPDLPATLFLDFVRDGNRSRYEERHFARRGALVALVLGECAEGNGRFLDDIINGVWAICEESFWGVPAHNFSGREPFAGPPHSKEALALGLPDTAFRTIDLFAAETGALLAWTWYLLREQIGARVPVVVDRIEREMQERILVPYRAYDEWWWLGKNRRTNNWNPWIHSNILAANLLMEPDEATRAETVVRVIDGLDAFLATYHTDGGCDEGTNYWGRAGGSLYDCLHWLYSASDGTLNGFDLPLVQEIGRYIYRTHLGGPWYVNFADGAGKPTPDGDLIYRYGQRIGDPLLMRQGRYIARQSLRSLDDAVKQRGGNSMGRLLPTIFAHADADTDATPPLIGEAWLDGIEVLTARERGGTTDGLYLAAKGGHNAESHNHNDVGQFIIGVDGEPALIDVGVETYTRETFGPNRYAIWTMRSTYHNLPVINSFEQADGRDYAARAVAATRTGDHAELSLDIAGAYPEEAGVREWRRTVRLDRGATPRVVLHETWTLDAPPQSLALHLMARGVVDTATAGVLRCASPTRPLIIHYDPAVFAVVAEPITINDTRLRPVWGERITRIVLTAQHPERAGAWELVME